MQSASLVWKIILIFQPLTLIQLVGYKEPYLVVLLGILSCQRKAEQIIDHYDPLPP